MNNLQLKATRQGLGLEVAQAAELAGVTKRAFQYWEAGRGNIPADVDQLFFNISSHYTMILNNLMNDIDAATIRNADDDTKPSSITPTLPFFHQFAQFQATTGCSHVVCWRIYQSVISHLFLIGKITKLNDTAKIPPEFKIWRWLNGDYEHKE